MTVTNPKNYPLNATFDGLLVGGGQTIQVNSSDLHPEAVDSGLIVVEVPEVEKATKKAAAKPSDESAEAREN